MQFQSPPAQIPKQFTSVHGLGAPLEVYPVSAMNCWVSAIIGVILIGGAGLAAVYGIYDATVQVARYGAIMFGKTILPPLGITAVLLFFGIPAAVNAFLNWNKSAVVYEKGLAYSDNNGIRTWGWHEVELLYVAITNYYFIRTCLYTLKKADGSKLRLDNKFKRIDALGQLVSQKVASYQYDRLLQRLRSGQTVRLGPIAINRDSITMGKKNFLWDDVEQVSIQKGYMRIKKNGEDRFGGVSTPVSAVPNLDALFAVVNQIVNVKTG